MSEVNKTIATEVLDDKTRLHHVPTHDRFVDGNLKWVSEQVERLMAMGFKGNTSIEDAIARKRKSEPDVSNPATHELMKLVSGYDDWRRKVPSAAALEPAYYPPIDKLQGGDKVTPDVRMWLSNLYDGRGLRSRAEVMKDIIIEEAMSCEHQQKWASLACGAAQPVYRSMTEIRAQGGITPHVTLVDNDPNALRLADRYAEEFGLQANATTAKKNILHMKGLVRPTLFDFAAQALGGRTKMRAEEYDVVDAVGILEYLPDQESWPYHNLTMAGAPTFLKHAYEIVKPGGVLVVGNMLDTHPQLGFTLNVVQWPYIQPRSIDQMRGIIADAGIDGELDVSLPDDGVYALYTMRKPVV